MKLIRWGTCSPGYFRDCGDHLGTIRVRLHLYINACSFGRLYATPPATTSL